MDGWILFLSILLALTLSILLLLTNHHKSKNQKQQQLQEQLQEQQKQQQQQQHAKQPPGPPSFLLLADLIRHRRSVFDAEHLLRALHAQHGPVVALRLPFQRPSVFVADRRLAHRALVEGGAAFADRPPLFEPNVLFTSGQRDISSASYGPYWRLVRRNLVSEILPPSRVELFAPARRWALAVLIEKLKAQAAANDDGVVVVMDSFKHAIFCLLVFMCFGVKLDDDAAIADIQAVQQFLLAAVTAFPVFAFFPTITKLLLRKKWNACVAMKQRQEEIFGALIRARREQKLKQQESDRIAVAYVDSLLELRLPEEQGRKLTNGEVVSLCSEFLSGGTDTTATALQWIMANLVRRPDIQAKLYEEIKTVVGTSERKEVDEKVLSSMPYLKAVILEGLRRHPPAHFVLPHIVTADTILGEYCIPKGADVNFMVAEIGWEGKVWEDPMEFRPERFLEGGEGEAVDITGSREIKMIPFGAGRRMCPGYGLAMLHLEYFVSNLVWEFEWKAVEGEEIDMSEKLDFTVVMKTPLRARILPRGKN